MLSLGPMIFMASVKSTKLASASAQRSAETPFLLNATHTPCNSPSRRTHGNDFGRAEATSGTRPVWLGVALETVLVLLDDEKSTSNLLKQHRAIAWQARRPVAVPPVGVAGRISLPAEMAEGLARRYRKGRGTCGQPLVARLQRLLDVTLGRGA